MSPYNSPVGFWHTYHHLWTGPLHHVRQYLAWLKAPQVNLACLIPSLHGWPKSVMVIVLTWMTPYQKWSRWSMTSASGIPETCSNWTILKLKCSWLDTNFVKTSILDIFPLVGPLYHPPTIRNLDVIMDPTYTMSSHVSHLVQVAFLKLRELSYSRRYLTDESTETAVHAYITSRLDYCNSLLFGLPQEPSMKMQSVMNAAARLVTKARKFDHITPVLRDLDWLPVSYRCQFKILLIVYRYIHKLTPTYLCKRLILKPKRGLRSDNKLVLYIPLTKLKLKTYGDRPFSIAGPTLWNKLPSDIMLSESVDIFKQKLKTHFFKHVFY